MSLEAKIMEQMKEAMKAKDTVALEALRAIKSGIILAKTEAGASDTLSADDEIKLLQKMAKQRKESIDIFLKQNREDLAKVEQDELALLEEFLPQAMSQEELTALVQQAIQQVGAAGPQDMGKVMGVANKAAAGRADGKLLADTVKNLLAAL